MEAAAVESCGFSLHKGWWLNVKEIDAQLLTFSADPHSPAPSQQDG